MRKINYIIAMTIALIIISHNAMANADSVQYWSNKSLSKIDSTAAQYNYKLGEWYARGGSKFDSALIRLNYALEYYRSKKNTRSIGDCNYLSGIAYARLGDIKNAIIKFKQAEKFYIEIKDTSKIIFAMEAQGFALSAEERLRLYVKTLPLAQKANLLPNEINILGNLGRAYSNSEMYDSTIIILKRQYDLLLDPKTKDFVTADEITTRLTYCTQSLGFAYYITKNYTKSFKYLMLAFENGNKIDPNYSELAMVIGQLGLVSHYWKKQDPKAHQTAFKNIDLLALLRRGQGIALRTKSFNLQSRITESLIAYYQDNKNYDSVIRYQSVLLDIKDSMKRDEQLKASAKFSEELKTADKEKEIIQLNADKKIASATANRNKIIFFLIILGLLSSIYFIVKRIKYRNLKEQEERDKNFRTKLSSDLHDDVGTILTSLSMQSELLELKASDGNKGTVTKIADMSRDATRRMRDTVWAIDSRKDNVMDLAYRMIDFADDMLGAKDVEFQLVHNIVGKEDKISAVLRQTIFLIFKEAITNAAKYGTGDLVNASLQKDKEKITLRIQNETAHTINIDEVSGLGLSNIKKRIGDIGGQLNLKQENNQFIIELFIPV